MTLEDTTRSMSSSSVLEMQFTLWESYGASEESFNQLQLRSVLPLSSILGDIYKGETPRPVCINVLYPSGCLYAATKTGDGTDQVRVAHTHTHTRTHTHTHTRTHTHTHQLRRPNPPGCS
jgi:hypothetical protein